MRGASACREFEICSEQGEVCVTALSNWARTNALTKHIERADPEAVARYGSEREHRNFEKPWISKIAAPQEYIREKDFTVERNFIDVNDHMNNVFYLDLAELVLPDEVYAKDESCEFEIEYRQAIKYGETVKCCYSETDEANFVTVKDDNGDIRAIIKLYKTYDA